MRRDGRVARGALLAAWVVLLAVLTWFAQHNLVVGTDLRLFLPSPTSAEEQLLLEEIGEGPGSRVLVIALGGDTPEVVADASRALAAALAENESFRFVSNGEVSMDSVPEDLLAYRYLLSPTLDERRFDAEYLRSQLQARARDLASPAGALLEQWIPRDPTLELLALLERWQPAQEPNRLYDVWFDREGERALLLAETRAPAFDPDRQRGAIEAIHDAFAAVDPQRNLSLTISGAGQFSVLMEQRTRGEAQMLGSAATLGMILLMVIAYRRASSVVLSALPLATAGLAGLTAVSALFEQVHGITLAFGFTLIGVAQDYPVHLLSHRRPNEPVLQVARELWPTLATGVASTCIAYLTFLFSGVIGLRQLACFTIAGLAAASLTTRLLLPRVMTPGPRDYGDSNALARMARALDALPSLRWIALALGAASLVALALSRVPLWESDLSKLTPVPRDLIRQDQELRGALGTSGIRYMLVVSAHDDESALRRLEDLNTRLRQLVEQGAIAGFEHAARYVPSIETQRARQRALPQPDALRANVSKAAAEAGFRANVFEPFVHDVAAAKEAAPLTTADVRELGLGSNLEMLLRRGPSGTRAFVALNEVRDLAPVRDLAATDSDLLLLDLKGASEALVAKQRTYILWSLAAAALLLIAVVGFALRKAARVYRVLAPMALTTLIVIAILQLSGNSLSLFHLIALMLAAGLGLDYALFFEHAASDPLEQRRTLHAVIVCSLSTLMVFALLAMSSIPVLQAIGSTVSLGVISNFVLAMLFSRAPASPIASAGPAAPRADPQRAPLPAELIPHQGTMCLLENIESWSDTTIRLSTTSHRSAHNPLRHEGRLRAVHLCEYGAQAMAIHGGLLAHAQGTSAPPGMLVSLRAVSFTRDFVHDLEGNLIVEAERLQASPSTLQYTFRITHEDHLLCEGRAAVVLDL